jgi:hypothetical protein
MKRRALRLGVARLGESFGGRLGWLGGIGAALIFASAAAGRSSTEFGMVGDAVRVLCWVAAGPTALTAARAPSERDRADGVELMVGSRGVAPSSWRRTRVAAAGIGCGLRVAVPALLVAVTVLVVSGSPSVAARALAAVVAGALAGAAIGVVAALCGEVGGQRGRSLFAAVVFLPWVLGDLWSVPELSLVGAVDAGLSFLSEAAARWS